jgi:cytochrome c
VPIFLIVAALSMSIAFAQIAAAADDASGEQVFNNNCRTCHTWKKDDNRLGPNLHDIIGRKAGAVAGIPAQAGIHPNIDLSSVNRPGQIRPSPG